MDAANSSLELLAHFDRAVGRKRTNRAARRGVGWVLQWSAAMAVLFLALCLLAQLAYCLAAELALARAARAGVLEATLPRATLDSVARSIERRLGHLPQRECGRARFSLLCNGAPVRGLVQATDGGQLSVTLAMPLREALPGWLRPMCVWAADSQLEARAELRKPGRQLPPR
jgi:hypothetical protein